MNEEKPKVNIKFLAKVANLSPITISRALRDVPGVSKKNRDFIKGLAEKFNYYPDQVAKNLRLNKTNTVGVILNDVKNPFYNDVLWSINEKLRESKYSTIICFSNWDLNVERINVISLITKKVDGIIMSPVSEKDDNLKLLLDRNIEVVFVDSIADFENISYSSTDHRKAAYISTDYLIKNGHRDILMISVMPNSSFSKQFLEGYRNAFIKNNLKPRGDLIFQLPDTSFENCYIFLKKIINSKKPAFTGAVFISDYLAISFYKVANELGYRIPDDFSVIGFDNLEITEGLNPPLTTVNQSRSDIGHEAVRLLLYNINNLNKKIFKKVINDPYLIIRDSVRKLV